MILLQSIVSQAYGNPMGVSSYINQGLAWDLISQSVRASKTQTHSPCFLDTKAGERLCPQQQGYVMYEAFGVAGIGGFGAQLRQLRAETRVPGDMDVWGYRSRHDGRQVLCKVRTKITRRRQGSVKKEKPGDRGIRARIAT